MPTPPPLVTALAKKVKGKPLAWTVYDDRVVIVMEDGRKLAFEKNEKPAEKTTQRTATKKAGAK